MKKRCYDLNQEIKNTDDEDKVDELRTELNILSKQMIEFNKEKKQIKVKYFRTGQYRSKHYSANFEQHSYADFLGPHIPSQILGYWEVFKYLEQEFNTDEIEFSRFVYVPVKEYYVCYEFIIDGEYVISSGPTFLNWEYREDIEKKQDFDKLYADIKEGNEEKWYEKLEYVREKYERMYPGKEEYGLFNYDIPPPSSQMLYCIPNYDKISPMDEIDGDLNIYGGDPASPMVFAAIGRKQYNNTNHAVTILGYDENGIPDDSGVEYLYVADNWKWHDEDEYPIPFENPDPDEDELEELIRIHPYVEPAIVGSVYFAGTSGPDFIELGLLAETDGADTYWRLYRSPHRTGLFTTEPGELVGQYTTEPV
jgi:hypothetical protein